MKKNLFILMSVLLALLFIVSCEAPVSSDSVDKSSQETKITGEVTETIKINYKINITGKDELNYSKNVKIIKSDDGLERVRIDVIPSTAKRDGYYAFSWNTKADGTGKSYDPNVGVFYSSIPTDSNGELTLYIHWINAIEDNGILYTLLDSDSYAVVALSDSFTSETVTIPSSVKGKNVTEIYRNAFKNNKKIKTCSLPSTLKIISDKAFFGCSNLEAITIPAGVTTIGSQAFSYMDKLDNITIPSSVTTLPSTAFIGSTNLKTINVEKETGTLKDSPWGAENATVNWKK